jgi:CRISPR-associated endonuclease Cas2
MIYLVCYDISIDKVRNKVAKSLVAEGFERLQLSVFAGLFNPRSKPDLWLQLQTWLAEDKQSKFYVIACTKNQLREMDVLGEYNLDLPYLLGEKSVIFI